MSERRFVVVAKVGAPHGIHGELKLHSFTDPIEKVAEYSDLYVKRGQAWQLMPDFSIRASGAGFLIQIAGCQDRDIARQYTHWELAVPREVLPPPADDEYYWTDLEGLAVINKSGQTFGYVQQVFEAGGSDILEVLDADQKLHLIPFVKHYVLEVNLAKQQILVDWELDY